MKTIIRFSIATVAIVFLSLTGCDYISEPFQAGGGGIVDTTKVYRNIFIDDFTGHKCVNCPDAAEMIETMKGLAQFKDRIVAVSVHTGFFAQPFQPPYDNDWRTTEGNDLMATFGPSQFPIGMVNRIDFPNDHLKAFQSWPDQAATFVAELTSIDIVPTISYNGSSRKATIDVKLKYLNSLTGDFNIVVLITESHIIAAQTGHSGDILDYEHNHMLRGSSNTVIGEMVSTGQVDAGTEFNYNTSLTLDTSWVEANCDLAIYVYNTANQEIIQVVEEPVM